MEVAATIERMRALRRVMPGDVGLVPTMGYLHEGHLSLVRAARKQNDHVIVSIFVNPTQFSPGEDFERYPRDPERDITFLRDEGVEAVFMPSVEEMYPQGRATFIDIAGVTDVLEGAHRPGHFRGVATVVAMLFNIVQPRRAYFGRKDAQQVVVVRTLVRDLHLDLDIVAMPIVREPDGLAMSSRNAYLSPDERRAALVLSRALRLAEERFGAGERNAECLRVAMCELIAQEPLARVDYVSVADPDTLRELERIDGPALVSLAVRLGRTRLIDNTTLAEQPKTPA